MTRLSWNAVVALTLLVAAACAKDLPTTPATSPADMEVVQATPRSLTPDDGAALSSAAADALERIMPAFPDDPRTDGLRSALRRLAALSQTRDADSLAGAARAADDILTQLQQQSEIESEMALYLGVIQLVVSRASSLGAEATSVRPASKARR